MTEILKHPARVFVLLIVLSTPLRLAHLSGPLIGEHEFRQTQTALSVWEIREHGFSLLHPRLPLFGPPWECPFEYPVFQLAAAAVDFVTPWNSLDLSIRLANLIFFYLTALMLYLLARLLFEAPGVALFANALFLFSPFHILWSRTSMIEYAATFFALAYLLTFIRWTIEPGWKLLLCCTLLGVLACLTKITTFILPLFVAGILGVLHGLRILVAKRNPIPQTAGAGSDAVAAGTTTVRGKGPPALRPGQILLLASMLLIPLAVGEAYIKYSDAIKERSPYTAWLSSGHPFIKNWNYGTLAQRLSLTKWEILIHRLQQTVVPWLSLAILPGIFLLPVRIRGFEDLPAGNFLVGSGLVLSPLVAILLLFNLYWVHTYYLIAGAPFLALFAGLGLWFVFTLIKDRRIKFLFLGLLCVVWLQTSWGTLAQVFSNSRIDPRIGYLAEASKLIGKDEPVIILSPQEWSAFPAYYLKRRAFMAMLVNKPVNLQPLLETDYLKTNGFRWLLIEGTDPTTAALATNIMNRWKSAKPMTVPISGASYTLYSLSD